MDRSIRLPFAFGVFGLTVVAGLAAIATTSNPITRRFREGAYNLHLVKQYHDVEQGNTEGAIAEDTAMIALFPNRFEPYMLRSMAYSFQGRHSLAIADTTSSLNHLPTDRDRPKEMNGCEETCVMQSTGTLHYNRAVDYESMGKHARAIADVDQALAINPDEKDAHFVRAQANLGLKEYRKATTDFDWSIQHRDNNLDHAYFLSAQAQAGCSNYKRAVEDMRLAIKMRPDLHYLWSYLGWYQYKAGQVTDAMATDQKALAFTDQHDPCPALNLGLCYAATNDEAQSHAAYERGFQMRPTPQTLKDARQEIAEEIRIRPGNPTMLKAQQWLNAD